MLAGHRWGRDNSYLGWRCVGLPVGGVESHQWCIGCGCVIGDLELYESKLFVLETEGLALDLLAFGKGYKPIEAGTYEEYRLRR